MPLSRFCQIMHAAHAADTNIMYICPRTSGSQPVRLQAQQQQLIIKWQHAFSLKPPSNICQIMGAATAADTKFT